MERHILWDVLVARSEAVEVFPCLRADNREFIGGGPYDIAVVVVVELFEPVRELAFPGYIRYGEFGRCR